ncbi:MAG: hypothetical protein ABSG04_05495, partial [Verrucomicrobiota bacterium]
APQGFAEFRQPVGGPRRPGAGRVNGGLYGVANGVVNGSPKGVVNGSPNGVVNGSPNGALGRTVASTLRHRAKRAGQSCANCLLQCLVHLGLK